MKTFKTSNKTLEDTGTARFFLAPAHLYAAGSGGYDNCCPHSDGPIHFAGPHCRHRFGHLLSQCLDQRHNGSMSNHSQAS